MVPSRPLAFHGAGALLALATGGCHSDVVTAPPPTVGHVQVFPTVGSLRPGDTLIFGVIVTDADGNPQPGAAITWTSTDTAVLIVSSLGVARARTTGQDTVHASALGATGTSMLTVTAPLQLVGTWNYVQSLADSVNAVMCSDTGSITFAQGADTLAGSVVKTGTCSGPTSAYGAGPISSGLVAGSHISFTVSNCQYDGLAPAGSLELSGTVVCTPGSLVLLGTWSAAP